jgi:hypothetical protein
MPDAASALAAAAGRVDAVVYGRRVATSQYYAEVRAADLAVGGAREPVGRR